MPNYNFERNAAAGIYDEAYQQSMYGFFKRSRLQNLLGQAGASVVIVLITWNLANQSVLLGYLVIHQLLVLLTAFTYYSKYTNSKITKDGLPLHVFEVGIVTKIFCGSIFWMDLEAAHDVQFVLSVFIVFCASVVGTIVTLGPLKRIARQTLVYLLLPGAMACVFTGHPFIGLATIYFLYVVAYKGMAEMHGAYLELISLRVASAESAKELEQNNNKLQKTNDELERQVERREIMERERAELQEELVTASREAGKAEIATGVLHNVGNVMNSVNVAVGIVHDDFRNTFQRQFNSAIEILDSNLEDLPGFFQNDPRAKHFVPFLKELSQKSEGIFTEMCTLRENVDHVIAVVAAQQSFATTAGVMTNINPKTILESALQISGESFNNHNIDVERNFEIVPDFSVDKQKLIQIFVNLIRNAINAIMDADPATRKISVGLNYSSNDIIFTVKDTGIGIKAEDIQRIFQHGFSTRKDRGGHGFGLHHSICAIKEMDGSIEVTSDGENQGAAFTIKLPIDPDIVEERFAEELPIASSIEVHS